MEEMGRIATDKSDEERGVGLGGEMQEKDATAHAPRGIIARGAEVIALGETQEDRCALSGKVLTPEIAELDHIIPVAKGGGNNIENLQVVHRKVNRMKGTLGNEEFIELCKLIAGLSGEDSRRKQQGTFQGM